MAAAAVLLTLVAVVRVIRTYRVTAQGFDEPCHVAAAIEFLDKGTYTLDPYNTPLARVAIGLPLYFAGERYPNLPSGDPNSQNYIIVGNKILHGDGHYMRNLELARSGVLPFLLLSVLVVFLWTRREFGDFAALMAVALFTTLPVVLAFSGMAYTDIAAACTQSAALFAFATWLQKPSKKSCVLLGITAGLALLAKFTTLIYLPAGAVFVVLCKWLMGRHEHAVQRDTRMVHFLRQMVFALLIALIVIWGGYRFSIGHVQAAMQLSPQSMPSFQHFPGPFRPVARKIVLSNPVVPAPALLEGIAAAYAFNKNAPPSYFLGRIKKGGWWYFFLADIAVKSPLPFLILCAAGFIALAGLACKKQWTTLAPVLSVFAILLATTSVKVNYGIRHVLVVFPLLAIVAGCGAAYLWRLQGRRRIWGRLLLMGLLVWQGVSTVAARHDYIAYFNELAGHDPSRILVGGCDLDCGQDVFRLSQELRAKHVSGANIALWTSADMTRVDLPIFTVPEPFQPVTGWFAISLRSLRMGDVFHTTNPPNSFAWLNRYQPVEQIGKTIRLYYIPRNADLAVDPGRDGGPEARPVSKY